VPVGEAGAGFVTAFADQLNVQPEISAAGAYTIITAQRGQTAVLGVTGEHPHTDLDEAAAAAAGLPLDASSRPLGQALAELLTGGRFHRVYLDLGGLAVHDAGAGLLAGLGATSDRPLDRGAAGLSGQSAIDLGRAVAAIDDTELIGVVPAREIGQHLLGLRGITSLRGRAAGADSESLLRIDAELERFSALVSPDSATQPGAGACGGLGFALLALGGRLTTGPAVALGPSTRQADLVVTGCTVFDFATRGGGVVGAVADAAAAALSPCIVLAGEVLIGAREMRTMGIEAAYAVRESHLDRPEATLVGEADLAELARRVSRSWSW
jgi:glycerate kinase